jgi:dipeptidyl aminopeptidase/acylaminoacyl peptidase
MKAFTTCLTLVVAALVPLEAQRVTQAGAPVLSSPDARVATDAQSVRSLANPNAQPVPIDNLYYTRQTYGAAWSPDGREVAFTSDITGRLNLWKVSAAGGWPVQLTQSDDIQSGAVWSPDGKWILYQQDAGGNELYDVYAIPSSGGPVVNLTNTPKVREESPRWSPDGGSIVIGIKPESAAVYNLAIVDWRSHAVRRLTNETATDRNWWFVAWSGDGKTIYANRNEVGQSDADVYSIEVATGKTQNLTPHDGKVINRATALSPDGNTLLITSSAKNGAKNVALLDIATRRLSWVTDTKWEAGAQSFSPDGKSFTYTINADGRIDAFVADRATGKASRAALPEGLNDFDGTPTAFSPRGDRLIVSHQRSTQPPDLWIYDLKTRTPRQLTVSAIASLHATPLPMSQIVHYKSFDGKIISALMWMPFNLQRNGSNPAIVFPHGGPTGQMVDYWNTDVTALVSHGYIVIAPNVRGSTGYGMDFQRANYQDLGGGDLQDEVYAAKFLQSTGYVDAKKIGIMGGSYGGFMTLMAIGKTPEVWASAVALYGIIDWRSMMKASDPLLQQYIRSLLGDPAKDSAVYDATSPIRFIHNAKAPLLVLQGDNDIRVPKEEAQQVVDLLKADGKTVDVKYYANEGHGFVKRENQIDAITRSIEWMDRYLKNRGPVP